MERYDAPDLLRHPSIDMLLAAIADYQATFPITERVIADPGTHSQDDSAAIATGDSDAIPIEIHSQPTDASDTGDRRRIEWAPMDSIQATVHDHIDQPTTPLEVQHVILTRVQRETGPTTVLPQIVLDTTTDDPVGEPPLPTKQPGIEPHEHQAIVEHPFDAPPEIASQSLWAPPDASVRTRSRLRVDGLITALAAEYGTFPVRELVWDLDPTEYESFRSRYDAGGSGGAGIWATDETGHVLLVQHTGESAWSEPGGKREPGESFVTAARREFAEETGLTATITDILEVHVIVHVVRDGSQDPIVSPIVVFEGTASGDPSGPTGEIHAAEWWDQHPDDLLYQAVSDFPIPADE